MLGRPRPRPDLLHNAEAPIDPDGQLLALENQVRPPALRLPKDRSAYESAKLLTWLKGDALGGRALRDYGCIAEPGRGWIMPKVLPSVSLA